MVNLIQGQIDVIIKKYSNANILDILYTTPANTFINLRTALDYGLKPNIFSTYIKMPELEAKGFFPNTVSSTSQKYKIIETILQNLFDSNLQYFRKVTKNKYAINEIFLIDFLFHNKDKELDQIDVLSIYNFILDFDNFTKIMNIFYLPKNKEEDVYSARRKFREKKPYKYSKKAQSNSVGSAK